ncbi:hypothetical protein G5V59_21820 [Nocardioides sp. W3-2-3]|uniref:hypothetical protein n=1 Tax=Nocardioides convexus TaxID=2712224 RepID=UPI00241838E3|nr:hypothetical protein [Nocardioides convexus]NHA01548.1 hypothetical protein [Nocardioides convexus]
MILGPPGLTRQVLDVPVEEGTAPEPWDAPVAEPPYLWADEDQFALPCARLRGARAGRPCPAGHARRGTAGHHGLAALRDRDPGAAVAAAPVQPARRARGGAGRPCLGAAR